MNAGSAARSVTGQVLALAAALTTACRGAGRDPPLRAWGTVEARQVRVASRIAGRVARVLVDEGERVGAGQPLVELDLADADAARRRARSAADGAAARERLLVAGAQAEDIIAGEQALVAARLRLDSAGRDLARAEALRRGEALPERDLDGARTALRLAESAVATRRAQLRTLIGGARAQELEVAAAARSEAEAALAEIEARLTDRVLAAPCDAVVLHRLTEPGEVARVGVALLVLGDLAHPYIDVFVPAPRLAEAPLGAPAEVSADAHPGRSFAGIVSHVASEAEFTPKNVQTEDQRARLVFRVRVDVPEGAGLLLPGMPAEARFRANARKPPPPADRDGGSKS